MTSSLNVPATIHRLLRKQWLLKLRLIYFNTVNLFQTESDEAIDDNQTDTYTEENAKVDCVFLRTAVVKPSNRAKIEEKLVATADYRKKICMDPGIVC